MEEESARDTVHALGLIVAALARDVSALARSTVLNRRSDPRRVLPEIAPAEAWRSFPRMLRTAAPFMAAEQQAFALNLADDIEGRPVAEVSTDG